MIGGYRLDWQPFRVQGSEVQSFLVAVLITQNVDSLVKSRIGERHCLFRKKGFDTGGVKNSKLFEALATSSWNFAAGVETPERGHKSEPI